MMIFIDRLWSFTLDQSVVGVAWDMLGLFTTLAVFVALFVGYWATSITVDPDKIVIKRWGTTDEIATGSFIGIEPRTREDPPMIAFTGGRLRAPWYHPNLSDAIASEIAAIG